MNSFVELAWDVLSQPFMKQQQLYLLSEHFSQDPIENYFGQLRSRGGWCQNPAVSDCLTSAQSIRVQGSMAMLPVRGNSSRKRRAMHGIVEKKIIDEAAPLPKRKRQLTKKGKKVN